MSTRPRVVIHNSVSVDGATTGFLPHLGQHYGVAGQLGAQARLVGSATMLSGLDHGPEHPPADPGVARDRPPTGREEHEYWFVVDSHGLLQGRLHELRAFPGLRDVVVLLCAATPSEYVAYLEERGYQHFSAGDERVLLREALPWIHERFGIDRILVDSGPILTRVLIDHGMVDEVSLLVHPIAVGMAGRRLFEGCSAAHRLALMASQPLEYGVMHLHYRVIDLEPEV